MMGGEKKKGGAGKQMLRENEKGEGDEGCVCYCAKASAKHNPDRIPIYGRKRSD